MFKKIIAALTVLTLLLTPVGDAVFHKSSDQAMAKGYRSGVKSFKTNKGSNGSIFNKNNQQTNKQKGTNMFNSSKTSKKSGGFLKGLMFGGLAGLLFGGLFGHLGILGSILGLMVNVLAIIVLISVITSIFRFFRNKRKKEEYNPWRR